MTLQYQGKTALVTGASGGIGAEVARVLAQRGGHVILVARREDRLKALADEIAAAGGQATALPCDVTDEASLSALAAQVAQRFEQIHLLVNNAGKELLVLLQLMKPAAARDLLEVNLVATAAVTRSLLGMLRGGAAVVNVASAAALQGAAGMSMYAASKAGVIALTRALARELAARRIRVNAVAPGIVRTEMSQRMFDQLKPDQVARLEAAHPLGFGAPRDVALAVAFLGSEDAAWITGHTLVIDGGYTA